MDWIGHCGQARRPSASGRERTPSNDQKAEEEARVGKAGRNKQRKADVRQKEAMLKVVSHMCGWSGKHKGAEGAKRLDRAFAGYVSRDFIERASDAARETTFQWEVLLAELKGEIFNTGDCFEAVEGWGSPM